jgi:hypothetical protein
MTNLKSRSINSLIRAEAGVVYVNELAEEGHIYYPQRFIKAEEILKIGPEWLRQPSGARRRKF